MTVLVLLSALLTAAQLMSAEELDPQPYRALSEPKTKYELPSLPFSLRDLEPHIDEATVRAHYFGHHQIYADRTNGVLAQWREKYPDDQLAHRDILTILHNIELVPAELRADLINMGGGFVNHVFYFATLGPNPKNLEHPPSEHFTKEIDRYFGSVDKLKSQFTSMAKSLFGSGYVWLVRDMKTKKLLLTSTPNQECPLSMGQWPLLCIDLWEHAYYLKNQYRRAAYIDSWWHLVDWYAVQVLGEFWMKTPLEVLSKDEL